MRVFRNRLQRVPHRPVMHIAVALSARIVLKIRGRRTGPIRHRCAIFGDYALDDIVEELDIVLPDALALLWVECFFEVDAVTPETPARFHFVVAAPQSDAGMIAQSLHLFGHFCAHVLLEGEVSGNHGTAEHEVLPNHDAKLVADVVKVVRFVVAAAPVTDHVHMGVARRLKNLPMLRRRNASHETVERNYVRALGEDGYAIHDERNTLAPLIWLAAQFEGTQTGADAGVILDR